MVRLRKIQVHARVDQGVCVVIGGVDGHYVGSDPNCRSATGPKREEIGRGYAGCRTSIRNIVKRDISGRDRVNNLKGCIAAIAGHIEGTTITGAQGSQVAAAERGIGNCYAMVDRRAVVGNSLDVGEKEKLA